jgi:hypothetical protein
MWGLRANLDEVVEDPEALRVLAGLDIDEGADLGGGEGDVLVAHDDLELLPADAVGLRPVDVVLLHNLQAIKSNSERDGG